MKGLITNNTVIGWFGLFFQYEMTYLYACGSIVGTTVRFVNKSRYKIFGNRLNVSKRIGKPGETFESNF